MPYAPALPEGPPLRPNPERGGLGVGNRRRGDGARSPPGVEGPGRALGRFFRERVRERPAGTECNPVFRFRTEPASRAGRGRGADGLEKSGTRAKGFPEFTNPKDGSVLVRIPGGTFPMGSNECDAEKPIHPVTLPPYLIGRVPVTHARLARVLPATGHDSDSDWRAWTDRPARRRVRGSPHSERGGQGHGFQEVRVTGWTHPCRPPPDSPST